MDSIIHIDNHKFVGRTNFRGGLFESVVALSVKEVAGVAERPNSRDARIKRIAKNSGVTVNYTPEGVVIDVKIWMEYGYSAADVSYRVQENVMTAAAGLVNKKIKSVNVKIENVNNSFFHAPADGEAPTSKSKVKK
jgi:uncharacterized alkaline shock family protein YloU